MRKREPLGYLCLDCRYETSATELDELATLAAAHQETCNARRNRMNRPDTGTMNADTALTYLADTAATSREEVAKIISNHPQAHRELQEVINALTNLRACATAARHALRR